MQGSFMLQITSSFMEYISSSCLTVYLCLSSTLVGLFAALEYLARTRGVGLLRATVHFPFFFGLYL